MDTKKTSFKFLVTLLDGFWSVPLAFLLFWLFGFALQQMDFAAGTYDVGFMQPSFLAIGVAIAASNSAVFGMFFCFRGLFRFFFGTKDPDGKIFNESKQQWKELSSIQKFGIAFGVYFSYFWAVIVIYLSLV